MSISSVLPKKTNRQKKPHLYLAVLIKKKSINLEGIHIFYILPHQFRCFGQGATPPNGTFPVIIMSGPISKLDKWLLLTGSHKFKKQGLFSFNKVKVYQQLCTSARRKAID